MKVVPDALRTAHPAVRWGAVGVALVVMVNLLALLLDAAAGGSSTGPRSSTYTTGEEGLAAYANLLAVRGHPVEPLRTDPSAAELDPSHTIVVLDPGELSDPDADALHEFVEEGGSLVAGGSAPFPGLDRLVEDPPSWSASGARLAGPVVPVPEVRGVERVTGEGEGGWSDLGATLPILTGGSRTLASVTDVGDGRVTLLADSSPLQNANLAENDNAVFGAALAGEPGRPVRFLETVHGYGSGTGFGALPSGTRWAIAGMGLAVLLWLWARGRRFGPPEAAAREFAPPRRAYADGIAATLARTGQRSASLRPVTEHARARLERRAGAEPGASSRALADAARSARLSAAEMRALDGVIEDDEGVMAAGTALAKLTRGEV